MPSPFVTSTDRLPPWNVDVTNVDAIAKTIRTQESNGNYNAPPNSGGASGAYQFIAPTWQSLAKKYNIGTQYTAAYLAPPNIQDQVATRYIADILNSNGGDVLSVPYTWYVGNPNGTWVANGVTHTPNETPAGNSISVNDYVAKWLKLYSGISGQSPGNANLIDIIQNLGGATAQVGRAAGGALSALNPLAFAQSIWSALTNRENWIRIGLVVGALLLAIFGLITISKSFGGPGVTDIAKTAAVAA